MKTHAALIWLALLLSAKSGGTGSVYKSFSVRVESLLTSGIGDKLANLAVTMELVGDAHELTSVLDPDSKFGVTYK